MARGLVESQKQVMLDAHLRGDTDVDHHQVGEIRLSPFQSNKPKPELTLSSPV
jgi:hypothetical protein